MNITDRLIRLVEIPSVSGHEDAICSEITGWCEAAKPTWRRRRLGNNLIVGPVRGGGEASRPFIGLIGHVDTVPPQGNAQPSVADGAVYGLGSCDMKGGIAVMVDLMTSLPADGLPVDLLLVFYDKEEVAYDENGLGRVLEEIPEVRELDFAFVLEPSATEFEVGCNGHVNLEVTFRGTAAHSARPWLGDNAVHNAGAFIDRIHRIEPLPVRVGGAIYRETVAITLARGGAARNVVPDRFMVNVNHRFPPGRTVEEAVAYLTGLVPEGADAVVVDSAAPGGVPVGNPVYNAFRARFSPAIHAKQGWTDVARLSEAGVDAVNYGPGHPELAHRADEHCPIKELEFCRDRLREFLTTYDG